MLLKAPIDFNKLLSGERLPQCRNLRESVERHLLILLGTRFGEYRYDEDYGCPVWDLGADNEQNVNHLRNEIQENLPGQISRHEPRLELLTVKLNLGEEETTDRRGGIRVKRRLELLITGRLSKTYEDFETKAVLYLSPVSFEP